jgi:hypothetical protein
MKQNADSIDLSGLIDMHMHTSPDVRPRLLDDQEAARQAAAAGMRAIVIKSHVTLTADRATLAQKSAPGIQVFGGLVLNYAVGGLNPDAVDAALRMGARIIWMPTFSAFNHLQKHGEAGGIKVVDDGQLAPAVPDILDLIREHDAILATGHLAVAESRVLVKAARAAGVSKIVVTHPELPLVGMPAAVQEELRDVGAYFERCLCSTTAEGGLVPLASILADVKRVGVSSTILATDFGQARNPAPVAGMRQLVAAALDAGFSWADVYHMTRDNQLGLLSLS